MDRNTAKRLIAAFTSIMLLISCLGGFTDYRGLGTAYYDSSVDIFDGASYHEIIAGHAQNGLQHAHYVQADMSGGRLVPLVYNGEVRGTYTVGEMIRYAGEQGYKVVAAINGDIFDMSSGTPKGLVIHEGNIVTSGYQPDTVMAFDKNGKASMIPVTLSYSLKGTIETVHHINMPDDKKDTGNDPDEIKGETVQNEDNDPDVSGPDNENKDGNIEYEEKIDEEWNAKIDFFNVPHGGANGLHLYNRHYAESTKTKGKCAEVVIECEDIQLKVNRTIRGIVKSVDPDTHNTPIRQNTIVLSTVYGSASYDALSRLKPGSEIEISVKDTADRGLGSTKECLGIYYSLAEDGKNVTSGGPANPRTALGVKEDGSLVMLELDGRQPHVSRGLNLYDLGNAMIDLGCTTAVNLDGGGSSVMYVRKPGKDIQSSLKSSPSGGHERRVANAVLLAYKSDKNKDDRAVSLNVYPEYSLVMPGAHVKLETYASNRSYEKVPVRGNVTYSVPSRYGSIDSHGLFTAGDTPGRAVVTASADGCRGTTEIEIVDDVIISPSVSSLNIEAGDEKDINIKANVGGNGAYIKVYTSDDLFKWSCDDNIGTIDGKGLFKASETAGKSEKGSIYIEYGNKKKTIPVTVEGKAVEFSDMEGHWAKPYVSRLAGMKILEGIGDGMFDPEGNITRAQFAAMLAKMTNADTASAPDSGFRDVHSSEWYYGYVNWSYANGIVSGMGDGTFAPDASITREQMTVMICNYAGSEGLMIPQTEKNVHFNDFGRISIWARDPVMTCAGGGIVNGFGNGEFIPQGVATRAQAASVLYKMCIIKGII